MLSIVMGCRPVEATEHFVSRSECLVRGCNCTSFTDQASVCMCGHGGMYHKTSVLPVQHQTIVSVDRLIEKAANLDRRAGMKEAKGGLLKDRTVLQEAFQLLVMTLESYETALDEAKRMGNLARATDIKHRMRDVVARCDDLRADLQASPDPPSEESQYSSETAKITPQLAEAQAELGQAVEITDDSMRLRSPKAIRRPMSAPVKPTEAQAPQPKATKKGNAYHPLTPSELTAIIKKSRHQKSLASWRLDYKN